MKFIFLICLIAALPILDEENKPQKRQMENVDAIAGTRNVRTRLDAKKLNAANMNVQNSNTLQVDVGHSSTSNSVAGSTYFDSLDFGNDVDHLFSLDNLSRKLPETPPSSPNLDYLDDDYRTSFSSLTDHDSSATTNNSEDLDFKSNDPDSLDFGNGFDHLFTFSPGFMNNNALLSKSDLEDKDNHPKATTSDFKSKAISHKLHFYFTKWLRLHRNNPYPTAVEEQIMAQETELTLIEIKEYLADGIKKII